LLVIGVIAGAIAAGYYIYLAITRPDLTWRQRGELVGRAIFEGVMAVAGTGILARLKVFAQVARFRALVAEAGGLGTAIRLVNKVPSLEKIAELLRLAEAGNVLRVLDKVADADTAILLLSKTRDVDQLIVLIDKINDASKLGRLAELIDQVGDLRKLEQLLDRVGNPDDLARMMGELGGPDAVLRLTDDVPAADLPQAKPTATKTPPPAPRSLSDATTTDIANLKDEGFVFEKLSADGRTAIYRNPTTGEKAVVTLRNGGPSWLSPAWGRNRIEAELRSRGFTLLRPTRGEGGLIYRNAQTGEEIRITPRPDETFRGEPIEKHLNDAYYRYRPSRDVEWGDHTTIMDKD
jgi:hypothetical protein